MLEATAAMNWVRMQVWRRQGVVYARVHPWPQIKTVAAMIIIAVLLSLASFGIVLWSMIAHSPNLGQALVMTVGYWWVPLSVVLITCAIPFVVQLVGLLVFTRVAAGPECVQGRLGKVLGRSLYELKLQKMFEFGDGGVGESLMLVAVIRKNGYTEEIVLDRFVCGKEIARRITELCRRCSVDTGLYNAGNPVR